MIKSISIENFAIIKDIFVEFDTSFTSITGQTGAGKSILLDAIFLLFGKRSQTHMIRSGYNEAIVEGKFYITNQVANMFDLPNELVIRRTIDKNSRNLITINNNPVTLGYLRQIMDQVGLIQTQNDLYKLLEESSYTSFIDVLDPKIDQLKQKYLTKLSSYQDEKKLLNKLEDEKQKAHDFSDLLLFQLNEIRNLNLQLDEKKELNNEYLKLKNFDKVFQIFNETKEFLESDLLDMLYNVITSFTKIENIDQEYQEISQILSDSYYNITEAKSNVYHVLSNLDYDDKRFDYIQERIYEIEKIEKKYQKEDNELYDFLTYLENEYDKFHDYDGYILKQKEKVTKLKLETFNIGLELSKVRQKYAKILEKNVLDILNNLSLEHTKFIIKFNDVSPLNVVFKDDGIDNLSFLVSFNEGEMPLELAKVASGGERARFMYALRNVEARYNNYSTIIFDEVDTGISGKVAAQMANHMKEVSNHLQLIVITHLPQVAAKAYQQLHISKEKKTDRIETFVSPLNNEERIIAIASMLSDEDVSKFAIEQAKALLKK